MEVFKYLIVLIGIFLLFIAGCSKEGSDGIQNEVNKIIVQKLVGEEDKYKLFKEITDDGTIKKVHDILESVRWENAEVSMVHPPHYKFCFEGNNKQSGLIYHLWIGPNKDKVELVIEGKGKYVQLSRSDPAKLFETITGAKLTE